LFTGLERATPLNVIMSPDRKDAVVSGNMDRTDIAESLNELRESLRVMHKEVMIVKEKQAARNKKHNAKAVAANFSVGTMSSVLGSTTTSTHPSCK
jgi:hypothetical protein